MKQSIFLLALLLTACEKPTPQQKAADQFFADAQNLLIAKCPGRYDMPALRDTFTHLRKHYPDSAAGWAARLMINTKIGVCPE